MLAIAGLFAAIAAQAGFLVPAAAAAGAVGGAASLIIHELGHVRAAKKITGVRPVGVSLVWLGAASHFDGAYARGRDKAKVAIAGPATSLLLALLLVPVLYLPMPMIVKDLLILLVLLNIAIGAISLVPLSPLDGYKLITGLLWSLLGSEGAALRAVRRMGRAWLTVELAAAGLLLFERPALGSLAVFFCVGLYAQNLFAHSARG